MLLRLAICRLRGDSEGFGVLQVPPEGELCVFLKEIRGQNRLARTRRDLFVHTVKPIEPELGVELWGIVVHGLEVVLVRLFNRPHRIYQISRVMVFSTHSLVLVAAYCFQLPNDRMPSGYWRR